MAGMYGAWHGPDGLRRIVRSSEPVSRVREGDIQNLCRQFRRERSFVGLSDLGHA